MKMAACRGKEKVYDRNIELLIELGSQAVKVQKQIKTANCTKTSRDCLVQHLGLVFYNDVRMSQNSQGLDEIFLG